MELLQDDPAHRPAHDALHAGADLRQHRPGRRNQPHAAEDAGRPAGSDAGTPGHQSCGKRYPLPRPFFVFATQNPIEQEGTYPLPEAQLDRFMFSLWMDYPTRRRKRSTSSCSRPTPSRTAVRPGVCTPKSSHSHHALVRKIPVSRHVARYASCWLATRVRRPRAFRSSLTIMRRGRRPCASQHMILGAKALAVLDGAHAVTARARPRGRAAGAPPPHPSELRRRRKRNRFACLGPEARRGHAGADRRGRIGQLTRPAKRRTRGRAHTRQRQRNRGGCENLGRLRGTGNSIDSIVAFSRQYDRQFLPMAGFSGLRNC